jgi:hypothetical protein
MNDNNIGIDSKQWIKISKNTTRTERGVLESLYPNEYLTTVLGDNTHDHLSPLSIKSNDLEDNMISMTKVVSLGVPLVNIISSVGECFEYMERNQQQFSQDANGVLVNDVNNTNIPFSIPNNNEKCYIRDCFAGTWIPGLNNIFDQAGASLKSFIDYHNQKSGFNFKNPLENNSSGLGQQLLSKGIDFLQYTAYFNMDLFIFNGIINEMRNRGLAIHLTLENINRKQTTGELFTREEIITLNIVNINYIWINLLIYCNNCVLDDEYFKSNTNIQNGYIQALKCLSRIRFHEFTFNQDGYLSNPLIYYRHINEVDGTIQHWISNMCDTIEKTAFNGLIYHPQLLGADLPDGLEYLTSQTMAATCMSQFISLFSFSGRSKKTADFKKQGCMNAINGLFKTMGSKDYMGYGWAVLKFSGDSSHIVYGNILESFGYPPHQIFYAVSERPLVSRLLANERNVYSTINNVFKQNFTGPGSEYLSSNHGVLLVTWNPEQNFRNIVISYIEKCYYYAKEPMNQLLETLNNEQLFDILVKVFQQLDMTNISEKLQGLREFPTISLERARDITNIMNSRDFLEQQEIALINRTYRKGKAIEAITNLKNKAANMNLLSAKIGASGRAKGHTQWIAIMKSFNDDKPGEDQTIKELFDIFCNLISNILSYCTEMDGVTDDERISMLTAIKDSAGWISMKEIFNKIISSHQTAIFKKKDVEKIAIFKQTRQQDWIGQKTGASEKIPPKVESVIIQMETLLLNCWKIYETGLFNRVDGMLGGGTNRQTGGGNWDDDDFDLRTILIQSLIEYNYPDGTDKDKEISNSIEKIKTAYYNYVLRFFEEVQISPVPYTKFIFDNLSNIDLFVKVLSKRLVIIPFLENDSEFERIYEEEYLKTKKAFEILYRLQYATWVSSNFPNEGVALGFVEFGNAEWVNSVFTRRQAQQIVLITKDNNHSLNNYYNLNFLDVGGREEEIPVHILDNIKSKLADLNDIIYNNFYDEDEDVYNLWNCSRYNILFDVYTKAINYLQNSRRLNPNDEIANALNTAFPQDSALNALSDRYNLTQRFVWNNIDITYYLALYILQYFSFENKRDGDIFDVNISHIEWLFPNLISEAQHPYAKIFNCLTIRNKLYEVLSILRPSDKSCTLSQHELRGNRAERFFLILFNKRTKNRGLQGIFGGKKKNKSRRLQRNKKTNNKLRKQKQTKQKKLKKRKTIKKKAKY